MIKKLLDFYIKCIQKFGKGYKGPEPGNIFILIWKNHTIHKKNMKITKNDKKQITLEKLLSVSISKYKNYEDIGFEFEEYVNGKKYIYQRFMTNYLTVRESQQKIYPFKYDENPFLCIKHVKINGSDYTKQFKQILGLYDYGIKNDQQRLVNFKYDHFKKIKNGDIIEISYKNVLDDADEIVKTLAIDSIADQTVKTLLHIDRSFI